MQMRAVACPAVLKTTENQKYASLGNSGCMLLEEVPTQALSLNSTVSQNLCKLSCSLSGFALRILVPLVIVTAYLHRSNHIWWMPLGKLKQSLEASL
jgi:hypothetical protein